MSGVGKAIGKVFKAVAKVAKVVLPIALAVGAAVVTGGLAAPAVGAAAAGTGGLAAGAGAGAASTIGATGSLLGGLSGAGAAGLAAGGTGAGLGAIGAGGLGAVAGGTLGATGSLVGAASGGGFAGWLSSAVSSVLKPGTIGNVISGVGQGLMKKEEYKAADWLDRRADERQSAKYKGAGEHGYAAANAAPETAPRGLDPSGEPVAPDTMIGGLGSADVRPDRTSTQVAGLAPQTAGQGAPAQRKRRFKFNHETGVIETA